MHTDYNSTGEALPSLIGLIEQSIRTHCELPALSDMGGVNLSFKEVATYIEKLHILFEAAGLKEGDKVAICGKNSSKWAVTLLACLTAKVVAVPILHEFKPDMIHHLVNHSDSKLLFVDAGIWENLDEKLLPGLVGAIFISEFGMPLSRSQQLTDARNNINKLFGERFPYEFNACDISYPREEPCQLALISYTSGSTGSSKGVMLSYGSLWSNVRFCLDNLSFLKPGDGIVNMLPLAHLYGLTIDMLHPFCRGCHCNFLTKLPSPKIILNAFAQVKPKLIITVPLILEKIIRSKVFPMLEKPLMRILLKVPYLDTRLLARVKAGLVEAFGGHLQELIIGGAALNAEVEAFLKRIGFPYTVGYGMTECGPLVAYAPPSENKLRSCGRIVDRMEGRISSPDPEHIPGDLWVRGENVMLGYYKNPKATAEVIPDPDSGWMNTGDLCTIDAEGFIFISGRTKTMILGPSGQNIYPEEIEQVLNNLPYVNESLVIDDNGRLVALVHPDFDASRSQGLDREALEGVMADNLAALNKEMPAYSKVSKIKILEEEFEKTPKRSIKRFLYQP